MILIYDPTRVFSFPGHFPLSGWYHPTILAFQIKSLPALFDASPSLTSGHSYLPSITEPYQFPAKQIQNLSTSHHVHGYYPTLSQYHFPSPNWSPGFHLCPSHPFPTQEPELQFFKKKKKKKGGMSLPCSTLSSGLHHKQYSNALSWPTRPPWSYYCPCLQSHLTSSPHSQCSNHTPLISVILGGRGS